MDAAPCTNIYPSADAIELREALSKYTGFPVSNLIASGPGMDGLLDGLCRLIIEKGDEVIIPTPTFAYYELPARHAEENRFLSGENRTFHLILKGSKSSVRKDKIIFLCSPNNPLGIFFLKRSEDNF